MLSHLCANRSVDRGPALKRSHMSTSTICPEPFVSTPVSSTISDNFSGLGIVLIRHVNDAFYLYRADFVSNKSALCLTYNYVQVPH